MAKIVCAWCGRVIGKGNNTPEELTSHVICEACYAKQTRLHLGEAAHIADLKFCRFLLNVSLLCVFVITLFIFGTVATNYVIGRFYPNFCQ